MAKSKKQSTPKKAETAKPKKVNFEPGKTYKLQGTGKSKHLAKGQTVETTAELAALLVNNGSAILAK